ncbi:hypothetical protein OKW98_22835 [Pseudomonas sp. KU26590]|uniref:hypothetical protein n=1 Tax=Pseudomonas sp. KU26590 TaxID=2991051 RepID=UPI00223E6090|nr:hypothetical protein [Pseudomonas sp. KU26590]UZJ59356.1 hypothetical protein OKW98_22835 [Pseudomonas sp. KU26590]
MDGTGAFIERATATTNGNTMITLVGTGEPNGQVEIYKMLDSYSGKSEKLDTVTVDQYSGWHTSTVLELGRQTFFEALNPKGDLTSEVYHVVALGPLGGA